MQSMHWALYVGAAIVAVMAHMGLLISAAMSSTGEPYRSLEEILKSFAGFAAVAGVAGGAPVAVFLGLIAMYIVTRFSAVQMRHVRVVSLIVIAMLLPTVLFSFCDVIASASIAVYGGAPTWTEWAVFRLGGSHWALLLGWGTILAVFLLNWSRLERWCNSRTRTCRTCGYLLYGNAGDRCPECGNARCLASMVEDDSRKDAKIAKHG